MPGCHNIIGGGSERGCTYCGELYSKLAEKKGPDGRLPLCLDSPVIVSSHKIVSQPIEDSLSGVNHTSELKIEDGLVTRPLKKSRMTWLIDDMGNETHRLIPLKEHPHYIKKRTDIPTDSIAFGKLKYKRGCLICKKDSTFYCETCSDIDVEKPTLVCLCNPNTTNRECYRDHLKGVGHDS